MKKIITIAVVLLYGAVAMGQVTVIENGNVGVGISQPTEQLEVQGNFRVNGNARILNARGTTILNGAITNTGQSGFSSVYIGKGSGALQSSKSNYNVAIGLSSLPKNLGQDNIAIGRGSLAEFN